MRKLNPSNFLKFLWQTVESDSGLPDSQLTPISQMGTVHVSSGVLQASKKELISKQENKRMEVSGRSSSVTQSTIQS